MKLFNDLAFTTKFGDIYINCIEPRKLFDSMLFEELKIMSVMPKIIQQMIKIEGAKINLNSIP